MKYFKIKFSKIKISPLHFNSQSMLIPTVKDITILKIEFKNILSINNLKIINTFI